MSLIKLNKLTKTYHMGVSQFQALKGIDLQINAGEITAIVGASGSGKSTLMNIIGFLDRGTTGQYIFSGTDVSRLKETDLASIRNKKIGFVFQSFFLLPRFNALHNVMLPLFYRGVPAAEAKEQSLAMLAKVGMTDFLHHKPKELSGGQQQRVAIARALVGNPEVILADEPTGSLDSKTGQEVMELFIQLNKNEQRTIIIITHDHDISLRCTRVIHLKDGRVI